MARYPLELTDLTIEETFLNQSQLSKTSPWSELLTALLTPLLGLSMCFRNVCPVFMMMIDALLEATFRVRSHILLERLRGAGPRRPLD